MQRKLGIAALPLLMIVTLGVIAIPAQASPEPAPETPASVGVTEGTISSVPDGSAVLASSATVGEAETVELPGGLGELGGLTDVSVPWLAAETPNGVAVVWGTALDEADPANLTEATAAALSTELGSVGAADAPQAAAASPGFCTFLISNVSYSGSLKKLYGSSITTCTGAHPGYITTSLQIRRSSWTGFREYSSISTTGRSLGMTQDSAHRVPCNNGGGIYDYQMRGQSYTVSYGPSPWHTSETAQRFNCGAGISAG